MVITLKNNRGMALVIVTFVSSILLTLTGAGLLFSGLNLKTTSNLTIGGGAMHAADTGIQHALALEPPGNTFSYATETTIVNSFSFGNGYLYTVKAVNDPASVGGNSQAIFTSEASGPNSSIRRIKAYIGRSTGSYVPPGTVYIPSTASETDWDLVGNFLVTGDDTNYDDTSGPNSAIPGMTPTSPTVETAIETSLAAKDKEDSVQGLGYSPGPPIVSSVSVTNASIDVNQVSQDYINAALPENTYPGLTLNGTDCSNDPASCVFGDDSSPQITYVNGDVDVSGPVTGSGVLVVRGRVRLRGDFNFHGLVIHLLPDPEPADAELEFEMEGNAKIYGSLMLGPQGNELEFKMKGNSRFYYSSQAMEMVAGAWPSLIPPYHPAKIIAWHEVM